MSQQYKNFDLKTVDYQRAYAFQMERVQAALMYGEQSLIFCEHPLVLTMGRLADEKHLLMSEAELVQRGVAVHHIDRGGEVTLHTAGQQVIYPILNLNTFKKDLHHYIHQLEEVVIDLLSQFDILAHRENQNTGVWVDSCKIASIGIGVKKWVTFHGIGLNVNTDLDTFKLIRPCGLDVQMASMASVKKETISSDLVKERFMHSFNKVFEVSLSKE